MRDESKTCVEFHPSKERSVTNYKERSPYQFRRSKAQEGNRGSTFSNHAAIHHSHYFSSAAAIGEEAFRRISAGFVAFITGIDLPFWLIPPRHAKRGGRCGAGRISGSRARTHGCGDYRDHSAGFCQSAAATTSEGEAFPVPSTLKLSEPGLAPPLRPSLGARLCSDKHQRHPFHVVEP